MSPLGRPQPLSLIFLLGMGMASERINCPSRCSCQYLAVNCTGQQLQEFPVDIPLDTRQLILAVNNVSYLPAVELSFLADLVYLDCRKNLLGDDLDFTFFGMAKLVYLDLSFNNLTQVTLNTFSHLLSLVVLKISDNPNLVAIEKDAFANNTWLRHLDVSRTGLTFLDTSTVRDLPNLRFLGLSDNLWHCNCSFLDFITWMTESNVHFPDADNITCHTPEGLRALRMPAVKAQLHFSCLTQLYKQDYVFLCLVGLCIFLAGTTAAWLAGICAVIYEVHVSKGEEEEEDEDEDTAT
ncbi:PREDICTED: leucine-rich repeat-containing protein 52 [Acanthisitta chloris]|uniref:leucine-rich repeat-containing protein 52 n=1 Tax=Acanthisitta chloris TaxID=57068 RepID=UPI0004F0D65A|nr:PREDICTED: leucine-rich repeat-containing protein 52 [Acanthisitta chloris]